jgi:hypothetical protein
MQIQLSPLLFAAAAIAAILLAAMLRSTPTFEPKPY